MKTCRVCKVSKHHKDFPVKTYPSGKTGPGYKCKQCMAQYMAEYRTRPGARLRRSAWEVAQRENGNSKLWYERGGRRISFEHHLWSKYKIEVWDWAIMYEQQEGLCACCFKELDFSNKTHVEHNHTTKEVRGLVCARCNMAIGVVEEGRGMLVEKYLKRFK